jgi:hypothetical protein
MRRILFTVIALGLALPAGGHVAQAGFFSAGPWLGGTWPWGNDTGGIIPYSPEFKAPAYRAMAADYCTHWGRLAQITSLPRHYRDFVGFVCMDRPGHIH